MSTKQVGATSLDESAASLSGTLQRAFAYHQKGELPDAERLYLQCLGVKADYFDALHLLGNLYVGTGRVGKGLELLDKAIKIGPREASAYNNRGYALHLLNRPTEALADFERALSLNPSYALAYFNRANTLLALNRLDESLASYDRAIALKPDYAEAHNSRGFVLCKLKRTADALAAFEKAIALKRDYVEAYTNRGNTLIELSRPAAALESFEKAIALKRGLPEAFAGHAQALLELNRPSEALASCNKALALRPNFATAHDCRGKALSELKRLDEALASFEDAIKCDPNYAGAYVNRGVTLREWGRVQEAEEALRTALRLNSEHARAFRWLAQQLGKIDIGDPLVERFERLRTRANLSSVERKFICFGLGAIYDRARRFDQAFECFKAGNAVERQSISFDIKSERQWQKSIRETLDQAYFKSNPSSDFHDANPIFIVGMPRSGTTLMEQILTAHSMIEGAGELSIIKEMLEEHAKKHWWLYPQSMRELKPMDFKLMGREYVRRAKKFVTKPRGKLIVDKMPNNFLYVGFIRQILPAAKIIHMDRDPLDVVTSIFSLHFGGYHPYAYDLDELAEYVSLSQKMMTHWHRVLPGHIYRQDYAALVENPEQEIRKVFEFLAVPFEEACLSPQTVERSVRTASAAQIRQPINRNSIGRWRNYESHFKGIVGKFFADHENTGNKN